MHTPPTALIADDEPLLRDSLVRLLADAWPELEIVAQARNGREAIELFDTLRPAVCFLDVHMPGASGIDAARHIGRRAHLVFVTAFHQYAVEAFEHGALDYLVKPVEASRLIATVARLRERLSTAQPAINTEELLQRLAASLARKADAPLRWIRASVGTTVRLIAVDAVDFLRADDKYTAVAWRDDDGKPLEAIVRMPLKELAAQLEPSHFVQVHRAVIVNLRSVAHVTRHANETAEIHLKKRDDVLPVSRSYLHFFKQM